MFSRNYRRPRWLPSHVLIVLATGSLLACPSSTPVVPDSTTPGNAAEPSASPSAEPATAETAPASASTATPETEPEVNADPGPTAEPIELRIACASDPAATRLCREAADAWQEKTGHKVSLLSLPDDTQQYLFLLQATLNGRSPDIDVMHIDVIWTGLLAEHLADLGSQAASAGDEHFAAMTETATVGDRRVGMPWHMDAGLLYYRQDLLTKHGASVPATWAELTATARRIQKAERRAGNRDMWGYVWQGKAYEGLTCDALEWIASFGGGTIVDRSGRITIDNPRAVKALKTAASWVGKISPRDVTDATEEEARRVFQSGNAVFMRNWPYAWSLAQARDSAVKGKVGIAVLPKGGKKGQHAAALGGWLLAVSKYSRHQELATDLARHMTSAEEQRRRFLQQGYQPTIKRLYQDAEMVAAMPVMGDMYKAFNAAVPRPAAQTGTKYHEVSQEFFSAVHDVLSRRTSARKGLRNLARSLRASAPADGKW